MSEPKKISKSEVVKAESRPRKPKQTRHKIILLGGKTAVVEAELDAITASGWTVEVIDISTTGFDSIILHGVARK